MIFSPAGSALNASVIPRMASGGPSGTCDQTDLDLEAVKVEKAEETRAETALGMVMVTRDERINLSIFV